MMLDLAEEIERAKVEEEMAWAEEIERARAEEERMREEEREREWEYRAPPGPEE
jgi:septal ring factor EnvC (AmiA/AmiB activator)